MNPTTKRHLWIGAGSFAALIAVLIIAGIVVARTDWFREFVRQKLIQTVENSTGGKVEIGGFQFDWTHLRADVDRFVLHGTEPADQDPLFAARKLTVELKLLSVFRQRKVDISSVAVVEPRVNFIIFPDGTTNVPNPAVKKPSDKSALQTIVDLAIGRFELTKGTAKFNQQSVPFALQGQNLRASLVYETLRKRYTGQVATDPLFLRYAAGSQLSVAVNLPMSIEADRIEFSGASFKTPLSTLNISGALQDLLNPKLSVKAQGQIDVPEIASALAQTLALPKSSPRLIDLNLDASSDKDRLQINAMKAIFGQSSLEASGSFKNLAFEDGSLDVKLHAAVKELAAMAGSRNLTADGTVDLQGLARIKTLSDYALDATLTGQGLSVTSGDIKLTNARLNSTISVDPKRIAANPIHLEAAGGALDGTAELANLDRYKFSGNLSRFQLQEVLNIVGTKNSPWGATIAGPVSAEGSLKTAPLGVARINLRLTPNGRGIPISGQIDAAYNGPSDLIDLGKSFLALPSSRLEFAGALNNRNTGNRVTVHLTSQNVNDFLPVLNLVSKDPVKELPLSFAAGGYGTFDATLAGKLSSPAIAGHLRLSRFEVEKRPFDLFNADVEAASTFARVRNATLSRGPLVGQVDASVGLANWKPTSNQPLSATVRMQNADVLDVLALAGQTDIPIRGALTLDAQATGTVGAPVGTASLNITRGSAYGEPLDRVDAKVSVDGPRVTLSSLTVTSNTASLTANATFDHPVDDYTRGTIRGHLQGNQVALSRIALVQKQRPGIDGDVQLNMDIEAVLQPSTTASRVELVSANGTLGVRGLKYSGDDLGDTQARIQTAGKTVTFNLTSNLAGSSIDAQGRTTIAPDYPTEMSLSLQNLRVERVLKLAGLSDTQAKGLLSVQGSVSGTLDNPEGAADITLAQAQYSGQTIDRLQAHVDYRETLLDVPSLTLQAGPNQLTAAISYKHPARDFARGDVKANVKSNSIQLAQLAYAQQKRPGLAGTVDIAVDAAGSFDQDRKAQPILLSNLSGNVAARDLKVGSRNYGALTLAATQAGQVVNVKLDSNAAQSTLQATGQVRMTPDYPVTADVTLQNVHYSNWAGLIASDQNDLNKTTFDALVEGKIHVTGPLLQPTKLTGTAELAKAEVYTTPHAVLGAPTQQVALKNDGPISLSATQSGIEVRRAHWTGPSTDISLTGKATLEPVQTLDLAIKANVNLALLQDFDRNVRSGGSVVLDGTVKGTLQDPLIAGRMEMKDAAYQGSGMLNGLSAANGVVILSGNGARIENLKGEVGGGDVTVTGGVTRSAGIFRIDLAVRARTVRIMSSVGATVVANANVKVSGTTDSSLVSGDVDVRSVAFNSRTDVGSILSKAAPPKETPGDEQGFVDRMRLNVNIRMGANTTFRTTFAQQLEATADLTLRGTAGSPGMVGRLVITEGDLLFFGTKYSVHDGSVSFYNPNKIEPILDLNLATTARGVDVTLVVTGPIQNMNLAYQSDPPLQFSEIVGLLAAGKMPTSDPVLLANQPATPSQTLPQMGESALLGAAVANPVAGRLQRVFGVSQLKIDPTFTSGSELPQARLTLQQQITSELTFTYVTNLTRADPQTIRVEWAIDTDWSAVATRQENGMIGMDLFYKKRFQ